MLLSLRELYEDVMEARENHQKRKVMVAFLYKNRLVVVGFLFFVSTVMTLFHDMKTMQHFTVDGAARRLKKKPFGTTDVVKLAIQHKEPDSNLRTAVCFKTLFGDVDLGIVIQWAGKFCRLAMLKTIDEPLFSPAFSLQSSLGL